MSDLKFVNDLQDISQELRDADDDLRRKFDALLRDAELRANQTIPTSARRGGNPKSPDKESISLSNSPRRIIVDESDYMPSCVSSLAATAASSPMLADKRPLPEPMSRAKGVSTTPTFSQRSTALSSPQKCPKTGGSLPAEELSILGTNEVNPVAEERGDENTYLLLAELPEENNSRAVLTALRALQSKIQKLERDKLLAKQRIHSLEEELCQARRTLYQKPTDETSNAQLERQLDYVKFLLDQAETEKKEQEKTLSMTKGEAESLRKQLEAIKRDDENKYQQASADWNPVIREIEGSRRNRHPTKVSSLSNPKSKGPRWRSIPSAKVPKTAAREPVVEPPVQRQSKPKASSSLASRHPREMPFVVGQCPGKSYSVTANLQRVFSLLKTHNPALCYQCKANVPCLHVNLSKDGQVSPPVHDHHSKHEHTGRQFAKKVEASRHASAPTATNLEHVLRLLLDELGLLKRQYRVLVQQYERLLNLGKSLGTSDRFDATRHQQRLKSTSEKLKAIMEQMEAKDEQIAVLKDVVASSKAVATLDERVEQAAIKSYPKSGATQRSYSASSPKREPVSLKPPTTAEYSFQKPRSPVRQRVKDKEGDSFNSLSSPATVPSFLRANTPLDAVTPMGLAPTYTDKSSVASGQLFETKLDSLALLKTSQKVQSLLREQRVLG